jgi:hypothetical protein
VRGSSLLVAGRRDAFFIKASVFRIERVVSTAGKK